MSNMNVNEMRMEQAESARDMKRERAMCAFGGCQSSHGLREGPKGWTGRYGGNMLCEKHYRTVVDRLTESVFEGTDPYWEE